MQRIYFLRVVSHNDHICICPCSAYRHNADTFAEVFLLLLSLLDFLGELGLPRPESFGLALGRVVVLGWSVAVVALQRRGGRGALS